eukprot:g526.t1
MILFGAQVVGQILSFVIFFLLLCGTYLFRVGLISLLSKHFKEVLVVTVVYIVWTAILGLERMAHIQAGNPYLSLWTRSLYFPLTVGHKLVACIYYVVSVRTVLRLGDPKFYTKEPWDCSIQLYREILRTARAFYWPNEDGEEWSKVLAHSARSEFEQARMEMDPMIIARLLVVGRDALMQAQNNFTEMEEKMKEHIAKTKGH